MSVSSVYSNAGNTDPLSQLYAPTSPASTTGATATTGTGSGAGSASTSVSDKAKLLQQLQPLSQSNPAEFKQVTADIATQLQAQAKQEGGQQGQALSNLASKFQQASQTGSLSALHPKHHHHHGGGASAASKASDAYQQSSGQGASSQISSIISQVLSQDTGGAATSTAR